MEHKGRCFECFTWNSRFGSLIVSRGTKDDVVLIVSRGTRQDRFECFTWNIHATVGGDCCICGANETKKPYLTAFCAYKGFFSI